MTKTSGLDELRSTVRRFLTDLAPISATRHVAESTIPFDQDVWRRCVSDLGFTGLAVPEESGGVGGSAVDVAIVMEETGRVLLPSPLLGSVGLALPVLLRSSTEAGRTQLIQISDGSRSATSVARSDTTPTATAASDDAETTVSGSWRAVIGGASADLIIVPADSPSAKRRFYSVEREAPGVSVTELPTADLTRPLADVVMTNAPAIALTSAAETPEVASAQRTWSLVLFAAEQIGAARAALEMATSYAQTRHQFGRSIGSFQAIKHLLADVLLEIEASSAVVHRVARALDEERTGHLAAACAAKHSAAEALFAAAAANIQIHGGIGVTWEHDCHLYFKRASAARQLFGSPQDALETLTDLGTQELLFGVRDHELTQG